MFCENAAKAGIPRNLKQSGDKVQLLSHSIKKVLKDRLGAVFCVL